MARQFKFPYSVTGRSRWAYIRDMLKQKDEDNAQNVDIESLNQRLSSLAARVSDAETVLFDRLKNYNEDILIPIGNSANNIIYRYLLRTTAPTITGTTLQNKTIEAPLLTENDRILSLTATINATTGSEWTLPFYYGSNTYGSINRDSTHNLRIGVCANTTLGPTLSDRPTRIILTFERSIT